MKGQELALNQWSVEVVVLQQKSVSCRLKGRQALRNVWISKTARLLLMSKAWTLQGHLRVALHWGLTILKVILKLVIKLQLKPKAVWKHLWGMLISILSIHLIRLKPLTLLSSTFRSMNLRMLLAGLYLNLTKTELIFRRTKYLKKQWSKDLKQNSNLRKA